MKFAVLICFAALLAVPFLFRPGENGPAAAAGGGDALELIIITPHNEQIRYEFAQAFDRWHQNRFGQRVNVIWNVPGGTSEIRKMLEAQFTAAIESGRQPGGDADMVFGGGSFEHTRLKRGVRIVQNEIERDEPISMPIDFSDAWLAQTYGENRIGDDVLYEPDKYWFGTALSGFGIVFNRDALTHLRVQEPQRWADLCNPKLQGWVALVNPNQSGSITTAFESILKRSGWQDGWRILRRAGANSRYFSGSSLKPPIDVSQGNAAMGICIDFFGRYQSRALEEAGYSERIGYIDPPGGSTIDVDPISMLRNAPHPEVARRFIEFCLSDQGQALWQFQRAGENGTPDSPSGPDPPPNPLLSTASLRPEREGELWGPRQFELCRLPITRSMYDKHFNRFIDRVNPYELVTPVQHPNPNFRDFIAPMFAAMVMDSHHELKRAWAAITSHDAYPGTADLVTIEVSDPTLKQMLILFDEMPQIAGPDDVILSMNDELALATIRNGWLKGGWRDKGLWDAQSTGVDTIRRQFGEFFRDNYRQIVKLADANYRRAN